MQRLRTMWASGRRGQFTIGCGALLAICVVCSGISAILPRSSTPAAAPTAQLIATIQPATASTQLPPTATARPTEIPVTATPRPSATPKPSATVAPSRTPTATRVPPTATSAPQPSTVPQQPVQQQQQPPPPVAGGKSVLPSGSDCPPDAPIKGNRGSKDWIYHTPQDSSYKATKPEECFATVEDAVAAGYRPPK